MGTGFYVDSFTLSPLVGSPLKSKNNRLALDRVKIYKCHLALTGVKGTIFLFQHLKKKTLRKSASHIGLNLLSFGKCTITLQGQGHQQRP